MMIAKSMKYKIYILNSVCLRNIVNKIISQTMETKFDTGWVERIYMSHEQSLFCYCITNIALEVTLLYCILQYIMWIMHLIKLRLIAINNLWISFLKHKLMRSYNHADECTYIVNIDMRRFSLQFLVMKVKYK